MDSLTENKYHRLINNGHRGYVVKGKRITRADWLKSLVESEGYNQIETEKRGICNVYTLFNERHSYEFKKKVEGEYLTELVREIETMNIEEMVKQIREDKSRVYRIYYQNRFITSTCGVNEQAAIEQAYKTWEGNKEDYTAYLMKEGTN